MNTRPIAFFDFDGTLTTGDSLMPFLRYISGDVSYLVKLAMASPFLVGYKLGLMKNDKAKEKVLQCFFRGLSEAFLQEKALAFSKEVLPGMHRPEGIQKLKWHQEQGHDCVIVSASPHLYLDSWGEALDFNTVIATDFNLSGTGAIIQGENCFGPEKVVRIEQFLKDGGRSPEETWGYGDTKGDLPMLGYVNQGFLWKDGAFKKV